MYVYLIIKIIIMFSSLRREEQEQVVQTAVPPRQHCGAEIKMAIPSVTHAASTTNFIM